MKIAIDARTAKWSKGTGIGNYTHYLLKSLGHLGKAHQFTFLWPDETINTIPFPSGFSYRSVGKIDREEERIIPQWLREERVDLYHLPQNGLRFPKDSGVPTIVTVHDLIPYIMPEMVRRTYLERFIDEMPEIVSRSHAIVTVSECARQDIIRLFHANADKIHVIPSAPSPIYRQRSKASAQSYLHRKYGIQYPFLLYVGGLNPRKNVAQLIWAFSKVYLELPHHHQLVIPGDDGRHREELQSLVNNLHLNDDVIFPGFVPDSDLPYFYNASDLFVYPSLYEGFGLPPLEAMASGTPVIASNQSSLPEVVGEAALMVHPMDSLGLSQEIYRVLNNAELRASLIASGLERVKKFRWTRIGQEFIRLYERYI